MNRECRGIIFHKETGNLVARRLHKFFNINEMDETKAERIDLSKPHILLTKADGLNLTNERKERMKERTNEMNE